MASKAERDWKNAVREATRLYVELGLIPRFRLCQNCNRRPSVHIHHKTYDRLDNVEWLCYPCHLEAHGGRWQGEMNVHARVPQDAEPVKS